MENLIERDPAARPSRVLIVTPVYNAERYVDEAILSVVSQAAPGMRIWYHVQDGGSTDGTCDRLAMWEKRIADGHLPCLAAEFHFSYVSQRDSGMYDALNRGFERLQPEPDDILTWINADDRLAPGAVATVQQVFVDVPGCHFLSARVALLNKDGAVVLIALPQASANSRIIAGLHDGRTMPFIMQEGTFFSGALWTAVSGVDQTFRLAGDWDLWRRMAQVADHYTLDSITGFHRRRPGQLSGDLDAYHDEIDRRFTKNLDLGTEPLPVRLIRYDPNQDRWRTMIFETGGKRASMVISDGRETDSCAYTLGEGFGPPEGPYPEYGLPSGVCWLTDDTATVSLMASSPGRYRVRLVVRPSHDGQPLHVSVNQRRERIFSLRPPAPLVDQIVEFSTWLAVGTNTLTLSGHNAGTIANRLLLIACEAAVLAPASGRPFALNGRTGQWSRVALIVQAQNDPDLLEATLASIVAVADTLASIFVVVDRHSAAATVVEAYRDMITGVVERDPQGDDLDPAHALPQSVPCEFVLQLQAGELLVESNLELAMHLLEATDSDMVRGLIELRTHDGVPISLSIPDEGHRGELRRLPVQDMRPVPRMAEMARPIAALLNIEPSSRGEAPIVWLLEDDLTPEAGKPLFLLAAALTMLGVDARHVEVNDATRLGLVIGENHEILSAMGLYGPGRAGLPVQREKHLLSIDTGSDDPVLLDQAIDVVRFTPRSMSEARQRLGLPASALVIATGENDETVLRSVLSRIALLENEGGICIINVGGDEKIEHFGPFDLIQLDRNTDPTTLSYFLSAADLALLPADESMWLAIRAWACGTAVVDDSGHLRSLNGTAEFLGHDLAEVLLMLTARRSAVAKVSAASRSLIETSHSVEALALNIRNAAPRLTALPHLQRWLETAASLNVYRLPVKSAPAVGLRAEPYRKRGHLGLVPLSGCRYAPTPSDPMAVDVITSNASLIVTPEDVGGTALQLVLHGEPGETWAMALGQGPAVEGVLSAEGTLVMTLQADLEPGPHRLEIAAAPGSSDTSERRLKIVSCEVTNQTEPPARIDPNAIVLPVPIAGHEADILRHHGDWRRLAGFMEMEPPYPKAALFEPFRWSEGSECLIQVHVERAGLYILDLTVTGIIPSLCFRPVVAGVAGDWSEPLNGVVGSVAHRQWLFEWPDGDVDVTLELSASQASLSKEAERDVGLILLAVQLALPDGRPQDAITNR
jgi:glycosyltransferase involved in cell wall biosynthesis